MQTLLEPQTCKTPRHRVRELVCVYRPARDRQGHIVHVASLALTDPRAAVRILAPLMADQPVETFAVACLSDRHRLLAWHVVSRGTRDSTPVSLPDVFVPACVTPGTLALVVVHNHPSGDPTPRELAWHRARYRAEGCLCAPADPMLVGLNALQHWLWQRLQASTASEVHA